MQEPVPRTCHHRLRDGGSPDTLVLLLVGQAQHVCERRWGECSDTPPGRRRLRVVLPISLVERYDKPLFAEGRGRSLSKV